MNQPKSRGHSRPSLVRTILTPTQRQNIALMPETRAGSLSNEGVFYIARTISGVSHQLSAHRVHACPMPTLHTFERTIEHYRHQPQHLTTLQLLRNFWFISVSLRFGVPLGVSLI